MEGPEGSHEDSGGPQGIQVWESVAPSVQAIGASTSPS